MSALALGALKLGGELVERLFPSEEERSKARLKLLELEQSGELAELEARAGIVQAEAKSEHALTATWRPITMLSLVALIGAHWLGFTPDNLPPAQVEQLLEIVKIGLGGYVVGRSAEKGVKAWKGR